MIIGALSTVVTMYLGTWFAPEATAAVQYATGKVPVGTYLGGAGGLHYAVVILISRIVRPILGQFENVRQYYW